MTMVKCPECGATLKGQQRTLFGEIFKWSFILLSILSIMLIVIIAVGGDPIPHLMWGLFLVLLTLPVMLMFTRTPK